MKYQDKLQEIKREIGSVVIGQEEVIDNILKCMISNGHVFIEGVPGLAKMLLVKTLAAATSCEFKRIQFTTDLLPADLTGISAYHPKKGFYVVKGLLFANFVLADEINRAAPKTQSAILEAMQERQVAIGRETFPLPKPFMLLATQNPIETPGIYPLPETQLDRFMFKILIKYPKPEEELQILDNNAETRKINVRQVLTPKDIAEMQNYLIKVHISEKVKKYIIDIIQTTRNPEKFDIKLGRYIEWGASPRASIYLSIAVKANAMMQGRDYVIPNDVKDVTREILRHRIILNYEGKVKGISTDDVIEEILKKVWVF